MLNLNTNNTLTTNNIFELRQKEWTEENIIENVYDMLKPLQKLNIFIKNIEIKDKKHPTNSELKKSYLKELYICLNHEEKDDEFVYEIPWLIGNKFYLSGNHKFVIYQLFDRPLVIKKKIMVRTNITTFELDRKNKQKYKFHLKMFSNKIIPFSFILYEYFGEEKLKEIFEINDNNEYIGDPQQLNFGIYQLVPDIVNMLKYEKDKNKLFSIRHRKNQRNIIDDIILITEIDKFSKQFMYKDNLIEEVLFGLEIGNLDDTNYNLKRIRFTEQILYSFLASDIYNYAINCKYKIGKYNINSKHILQHVNHKSPAAQFDFNLNPLAELHMICKLTLTGHGGFTKENVPTHLRDLYSSMYGKICCVDTGDRDNCGTSQQLVPDIVLNDDLSFKDEMMNNDIISVAVQQVPFLEHDDATRLQMASSQQRHAVMLREFEPAIIQSGNEFKYSKYSTFIFIAEDDGHVIYLDNESIIVKYKNNKCKIFYIGDKKLYLNFLDFYHVYFGEGDFFKKGDIIAESNFFKNGRITLGRNLKTAIMVYHGYNYEDAIVISDRLIKEKIFNSVHYFDVVIDVSENKILLNLNDDPDDYKILPKIGEKYKKGDVIAKIKTISSHNFDVIFEKHIEKKVPYDCTIIDVKIYKNKVNEDIPQYKNEIERLYKEQKNKFKNLKEKLSQYLSNEEIDVFLDSIELYKTDKMTGNYAIKGEVIEGIKIEITGKYEKSIKVGDKIGNRHGNKGVISKIVPHDLMPENEKGEKVDVIINPLGVPSRMNIGQLFELHLAKSFVDLKKQAITMIDEENLKESKQKIKKYILDYIDLVDNTQNKIIYKQYKEYFKHKLKNNNVKDIIEELYLIQPPFESITLDQLKEAMKYTNTKFKEKYYDNFIKEKIINPVADGYMYFFKLNHIADEKLAKRGVGPYSTKTSQPLDGKNRKGGQRLGEMEIWALAAHNASINLNEMLKVKSDSIQLRNKYISQIIFNDVNNTDDEDDPVSQSIRLLQNYLKLVGLDYEIEEERQ